MQAKGSAEDLGKGLPNPSDAADQAKGLASDAKSKVKEEANVAGDVSDLPNHFDGAGGIADQVPIPPFSVDAQVGTDLDVLCHCTMPAAQAWNSVSVMMQGSTECAVECNLMETGRS